MKSRISIIVLLLSITASAFSEEAEIGGLWYDLILKAQEAKVIQYKNDKYSGNIIIPKTVDYEGVTYSVTSIGESAFSYCFDLTSVSIPKGVTNIGRDAFYRCDNLTSVTIPNTVTSIGMTAFGFCSSLPTVTIPNSVTSIEMGAFEGCSSLISVTIPNSVTRIELWTFMGCKNMTSVTIPGSVTRIGDNAFYGCSSLTSVTIPNSVTSIDIEAFRGCSHLNTVTMGNSVKTIYEYAFAECPELTDVYLYAVEMPRMIEFMGSPCTNAFEGSYIEYATLHVPASSINAYKTTEPWKNFKTIVAVDGETPDGVTNIRSMAVMINNNANVLNISGAPEGCLINIYDSSGKMAGSAKVDSEITAIPTLLRSGEIGIVKIGEKSVKVMIK